MMPDAKDSPFSASGARMSVGPVIDVIRERGIRPHFMITHRSSLKQAVIAFKLLAVYRDGAINAVVDMF
jgi:hypothetical protein